MKYCLACDCTYQAVGVQCPNCGDNPLTLGGFVSYAPELAREGSGFKASHFAELARLEETNFWFRARNSLIQWALKKHASHFTSLLEVGCGTGFVLSGIANHFPNARLCGSEIFSEGLRFAADRLPGVELIQMDARKIPFEGEFDVVGAFDVIEHIEEDLAVLVQMHKALKPNGVLILTIPQHAWLWSAVDESACHVRRYSAAEIREKLRATGFRIVRSSSFVTTLLPAMMIARLLRKYETDGFDPAAELKISPTLNRCMEWMLRTEISGIKAGIDYPVGGSRLVVATKR